ncbi:hypothetical protein [Rathayibacter sp. VKM Ac-2630]|nr:hypothetical protein [Rathayibacter sp. VKM Ac-2630]
MHQDTDFAQEAIDRQKETDRAKYGENDLRRGAIYSVKLRDK